MNDPGNRPTRPARDPRTAAGSNYGDVVPDSPRRDPSKGAELERDAMPADADFSAPPPDSGADVAAEAADLTPSPARKRAARPLKPAAP